MMFKKMIMMMMMMTFLNCLDRNNRLTAIARGLRGVMASQLFSHCPHPHSGKPHPKNLSIWAMPMGTSLLALIKKGMSAV